MLENMLRKIYAEKKKKKKKWLYLVNSTHKDRVRVIRITTRFNQIIL